MDKSCENCGWLSVNPSGAMFCGYSDERTWKDECCMAWKGEDEPHTNADRIRAMSNEELAELIGDNIDCAICKKMHKSKDNTCPASLTADGEQCYDIWLDWLKEGE